MRKVFLVVIVFVACAPASHAAFPGQNGKIAFEFFGGPDECGIATINPDGTGFASVTPGSWCEHSPAWSPDGKRILFDGVGVQVMDADGSNRQFVYDTGAGNSVDWSPDGSQVVIGYVTCGGDPQRCAAAMYRVNSDGSGATEIWTDETPGSSPDPSWSPDGSRIAFARDNAIWLMDPDGTDLVQVPNTTGSSSPDWAPNASSIAVTRFSPGDFQIYAIRPDGTALTQVTSGPGISLDPAWSPDGTRIAYRSNRHQPDPGCATAGFPCDWEIYTVGTAGGDVQRVTTDERREYVPDWQPIPINSYPRPKGATPTQVALVPAYTQCTAPNRTHGPPLAFPSCNTPAQGSDELTVGTGDSNGKPTKSYGYMRYDAIVGNPATAADEADVGIAVDVRDIYTQGTLADYTGELRARVSLRITDKLNTPHPGGPGAATVSDASLGATVPCSATGDTTEGAHCSLLTTFDAIAPGTVTETKRSIWALGAAQLDDGGADSNADTPGDNTLFMTQGLFIP